MRTERELRSVVVMVSLNTNEDIVYKVMMYAINPYCIGYEI